jgi:DNA-directed RNA polymerase I subunit RPA2
VQFFFSSEEILAALKPGMKIGQVMEKFLATGRISSSGNLLVPQADGRTIVVENISWARYLSHFQSIHRGSFFLTMRSTDVRKLTADSWGFICPVHTPDGEPCGLLNHLAKDCEIVCEYVDSSAYPVVFASLGMAPVDGLGLGLDAGRCRDTPSLAVVLDGNVVGFVPKKEAGTFVKRLRSLKLKNEEVNLVY